MIPSVQVNPALILVVEDDLVVQMQLRHSMEKEGYSVMTACNGQEALNIYTEIRPDIVLLDAMMPVMDGFTCCAQLQALNKCNLTEELCEQVSILMITGLDDPDSVDKAFASGATDYITKPIHWVMLRQRVRRLVQMQFMMKELQRKIRQEQLIATITRKIRTSLRIEEILNTTVTEVQKLLETDRVIVIQFQPNGKGTVIVESKTPGYHSILGRELKQCCCDEQTKIRCKKGLDRIGCIAATSYTTDIPECQIISLNPQAYSYLSVPIIQIGVKWGLLIAYQSSMQRQWQSVEIELLQQLADQLVIAIQQAQLYEQLTKVNQELQNLATIDSLTQIANRRFFDQSLLREWKRLERECAPLSLVMADIDFFKCYNDRYGHQAGDECLRKVAGVLRQHSLRPADVVARYGGEEFALILPNTDVEGAFSLAEAIRLHIKAEAVIHHSSEVSHYLTISLGVATVIPQPGMSPEWLIAQADAALYQAKQAGRDRVIVAPYNQSLFIE
jgi:diguanylate cyclase (GGDEF)-like protein